MSVIGLVSMEDLGVSNHEDERRTLDVVGRDGQAFVRVSFGLGSRMNLASLICALVPKRSRSQKTYYFRK